MDLSFLFSFSENLVEIQLSLFIKGTILVLVSWTITSLWRRSSSATKHIIWVIIVISLLILPVLSFLLPKHEIALLTSISDKSLHIIKDITVSNSDFPNSQVTEFQVGHSENSPSLNGFDPDSQNKKVENEPEELEAQEIGIKIFSKISNIWNAPNTKIWILLSWLFGILFFGIRYIIGHLTVSRLTKKSRMITNQQLITLADKCSRKLKLKNKIMLCQCENIRIPLIKGWRNPKIYLPSGVDCWSKDKQKVILLHELAHIKRYDYLINIISNIVTSIYWFNPCIWLTAHKIYTESEKACDDLVLSNGIKSMDYAKHLVDFAQTIIFTKRGPLVRTAVLHKSFMEGRLISILNHNLTRRLISLPKLVILVVISLFIVTSIAVVVPKGNIIQEGPEHNLAKEQLRKSYFLNDFENGYELGKKYVDQFPNSLEIFAWHYMNKLNHHFHIHYDAIPIFEKIIEENKNSPWGYFVLTEACSFISENKYKSKALLASEKMLLLDKKHPDLVWMRAKALFYNKKYEELNQFTKKNIDVLKNPSELLVMKGKALKDQGLAFPYGKIANPEKWDQALLVFRQIQKYDPSCVNSLIERIRYQPDSEDIPIIRKALKISPFSNKIRSSYWRAIFSDTKISIEERKNIIETDIQLFKKDRGDYPGALLFMSKIYSSLSLNDLEKRTIYGDVILQKFPESIEAEWILIERMRLFKSKVGRENLSQLEYQNEWRKMLNNYINKEKHYLKPLLAEVYQYLYESIKDDDSVPPEKRIMVAQKMANYAVGMPIQTARTYSDAAIYFAENSTLFDEALRLAQRSINLVKNSFWKSKFEHLSEKEYEEEIKVWLYQAYDALGWVYFKKGELGLAETTLLYANQLSNRYVENVYHLGKFYETKENYKKAEEYFVDGLKLSSREINPNKKALRDLYVMLKGDEVGYTAVSTELENQNLSKRKTEILASRIDIPDEVSEFSLESLDGELYSSNRLRQKITIIYFWGTWSGLCARELPEFQRLHNKYKNDPDVVFLSINNDRNVELVKNWLKNRNYDFQILLDHGFAEKEKVDVFPTSWFVDRQGRICYKHKNWSNNLFEEFSWRIEDLKKGD
jgi:beta-lactamase regulating signal transducer with metallopeptidase domain/peroxiredoxin